MMKASDSRTPKFVAWLIVVCVAAIFSGGCGMYPLGMAPPVSSGVSHVSFNDLKINEASPLFYSQAFIRQYAMFNERMRGFYRGIITPDAWNQNGCLNTVSSHAALLALKKGDAGMENGSFSYSYSYHRDMPSAYFANFCTPR
jgi:hypothetical protein